MLPFLPMLLTNGLWCWKSPMILELLLGMVTLAEGDYKQPAGPSLTFRFPISGTSFKINLSSEESACLQLLMTHWKERELRFERLGNLSSVSLLSPALNHETWLQTADLNLEVQPSWVDFRVPPRPAPLSLSALLQENDHNTQWGDRISGNSKGVRKGGAWGWGFLRFLLPSPCLPRSSPWGFRPPTFSSEVPLGVPGSHGPADCSELSLIAPFPYHILVTSLHLPPPSHPPTAPPPLKQPGYLKTLVLISFAYQLHYFWACLFLFFFFRWWARCFEPSARTFPLPLAFLCTAVASRHVAQATVNGSHGPVAFEGAGRKVLLPVVLHCSWHLQRRDEISVMFPQPHLPTKPILLLSLRHGA